MLNLACTQGEKRHMEHTAIMAHNNALGTDTVPLDV